jgi:hypothetical protein
VVQRWLDIYRDHGEYISTGGRSSMEQGEVRKQMDVPLQQGDVPCVAIFYVFSSHCCEKKCKDTQSIRPNA